MRVMRASNAEGSFKPGSLVAQLLLVWYVSSLLFLSVSPIDPKIWVGANVFPILFVVTLAITHRAFPLSNLSYLLISVWLSLHTIGAHYTYPQVPLGFWLERWFDFHRNHFDRIVHFGFGFFFTFPLIEIFRRRSNVRGWLLTYLVLMTILGFSAFWEIMEAWVGQIAHPDFEKAMVGHQGDIWDPQRDMASALYGSLVFLVLLAIILKLREPVEEAASAYETTSLLESEDAASNHS
jgi:putative membrane protein